MVNYSVKKVLNNNVVIAERKNEEFILVGKAIGFNAKKGDEISKERIENVFIKKDETMGMKYGKVLNTIDSEYIGIAEEIISMCETELAIKLNNSIHVSLADHISFAISRNEKGIKIENPFLSELSVLYPVEFGLAKKALNMINERFNAELPRDEIGFICLHIRAAIEKVNVTESLAYTRKIGEIVDLISKLLRRKIDKDSLEYARTVTHLSFMLERVQQKKSIRNYLLESIKQQMYGEYDMAVKVGFKIENLFSVKVPEDEIGYIALHLKRLSEV